MVRRLLYILATAGALHLVAPAAAQQGDAPKCPQDAVALPPELAPWSMPVAITAATRPEELKQAELKLGVAAKVALVHTPEIQYAARPAKPGGGVAYGGLLAIAIQQAGVYRVALGNPSWVDLVKDGVAAESIRHGGGPACSGIRKMVDYDLTPGDYTLQLSAGGDAETSLMIVKLP